MNIIGMLEYSPELPEPIIHRIQSLLNLKKAAQTTLLSKSWRMAWSTRPTVDLDEFEFPIPDNWETSSYPEIDELQKFAKKTFRMYKESNMSIETFKLRLTSPELYVRSDLATKWTSKALKLGATDLTFEIDHPGIAIPLGAVSGRENVASLCLQSSTIHKLKILKCPGLKSLTLINLDITRESFFNVISGCPLIENLSLSDIHGTHYNDIDAPPILFLHNLRSLVLCRVSSRLRIKPLFLDDLSSKFPNLKDLTLELSSSNVAYLRKKGEPLIISSRSVEVLNFRVGTLKENYYEKNDRPWFFEFDVPSIREFTLNSMSHMPNLRFTSASMDRCESHVSLTQPGHLSGMWFIELRKLLTELRGSKIHLCLHLDDSNSLDYYQHKKNKCLSVFELENLTMNTDGFRSRSLSDLLDGLFRICRPKMITQYISPSYDYNYHYCDDDDDEEEEEEEEWKRRIEEKMYDEEVKVVKMFDSDDEMFDNAERFIINNDVVLCWELIQGMKTRRELFSSQNIFGLRDVDELTVHKLLDGVWRPQPLDLDSILDEILDDSSEQRIRFRFQLKWKPSYLAKSQHLCYYFL